MSIHMRIKDTKTVLFITPVVKKFRVPFFIRLHETLSKQSVNFRVIYSEPGSMEKTKEDSADLPLNVGKKVTARSYFNGRLTLQHVPLKEIMVANLVIIVNANKFLVNYPIIVLSRLTSKKVAFWGHAYNHQSRHQNLREKFKACLVNRVDWWFVYSQHERYYLIGQKMPESSITVIENAIDTTEFHSQIQSLEPKQIWEMRNRFGINSDNIVGLYCGSLYERKEIPFLLDVVKKIKKIIPAFVLLVVGSGPDSDLMSQYAEKYPWVKYRGAMFGIGKAVAYRIADIVLNPGLVGLGILDCFAAGLPFVTSNIDFHCPEIEYLEHGPEIEYLEHGVNGLMLPFDVEYFSQQVANLILDEDALNKLKRGAMITAGRVTLENMVDNVSRGVVSAISVS